MFRSLRRLLRLVRRGLVRRTISRVAAWVLGLGTGRASGLENSLCARLVRGV